jgi:antimicrobial peptide system SdpB family protein
MLKFILSDLKINFNTIILKYSKLNPWTNVYGFARCFFAIGLLLTFLLNEVDILFPIKEMDTILFSYKISLYGVLKGNLILSKIITIIVLIWVISGYLPQISGILHWWVCYSFFISTPLGEGGDQIMSIVTLFLIPICITDNRINHWHVPKERGHPYLKLLVWSIFSFLSIQISILYFDASISKLNVDEWSYGTAIYYWFTHETHGVATWLRNITYLLTSNKYIVVFLTWGTMILEFILGGWIFMKRNTWNWKLLLLLGIIFHVGIIFAFGLITFFFSMLAVLFIYFYPKESHIELKFFKK